MQRDVLRPALFRAADNRSGQARGLAVDRLVGGSVRPTRDEDGHRRSFLPWFTQFAGQDKPIAGQTGGRMGASYRPFLVAGDPSRPDFQVPGIRLPEDLPLTRIEARSALLGHVEEAAAAPSSRWRDAGRLSVTTTRPRWPCSATRGPSAPSS